MSECKSVVSESGEPAIKKAMSNSKTEISEGALFAIGNALIDISTNVEMAFLEKYDLKANDGIIAEEKHMPIFKEIQEKYSDLKYSPGGATQNSFRVAQWIFDKPNVTTFFGCIGRDKLGTWLYNAMTEAGCTTKYLVDEEQPTGTCASLITGNNRSLCGVLGAADCYKRDHLMLPENWDYVEKARVLYSAGFHLSVAPDAMVELGKHAAERNKIFCTNLSAPYICQAFKEPQMNLMPYVDFLFGNETEAAVLAKEQNFGTEDLSEIALKAAALPKENKERERVVIFTHGEKPTIIAKAGKVQLFDICPIAADKIVDTNGAGDAFVGGFLTQLVQGNDIEKCVDCGNFAANYIIQRSGTTLEGKANYE